MSNNLSNLFKGSRCVLPDQRGITGLETAIVLIAFAALSTGLFSSDKAKETINAGLSEARGTLELKGSVTETGIGTTQATAAITAIVFQVSNAAAGESIDMTPGNTVIKYSDVNQTFTMNETSEFTATNVASFGDSDSLLEIGEVFEINLVTLNSTLATDLGVSTEFTLEIVPPSGAVLYIGRRTPVSLESNMNFN